MGGGVANCCTLHVAVPALQWHPPLNPMLNLPTLQPPPTSPAETELLDAVGSCITTSLRLYGVRPCVAAAAAAQLPPVAPLQHGPCSALPRLTCPPPVLHPPPPQDAALPLVEALMPAVSRLLEKGRFPGGWPGGVGLLLRCLRFFLRLQPGTPAPLAAELSDRRPLPACSRSTPPCQNNPPSKPPKTTPQLQRSGAWRSA